jgi:hypothetical protein
MILIILLAIALTIAVKFYKVINSVNKHNQSWYVVTGSKTKKTYLKALLLNDTTHANLI